MEENPLINNNCLVIKGYLRFLSIEIQKQKLNALNLMLFLGLCCLIETILFFKTVVFLVWPFKNVSAASLPLNWNIPWSAKFLGL